MWLTIQTYAQTVCISFLSWPHGQCPAVWGKYHKFPIVLWEVFDFELRTLRKESGVEQSLFSFSVACVTPKVGHGVLRHDLYHTVGRMLDGLGPSIERGPSYRPVKPSRLIARSLWIRKFLLCLWHLWQSFLGFGYPKSLLSPITSLEAPPPALLQPCFLRPLVTVAGITSCSRFSIGFLLLGRHCLF